MKRRIAVFTGTRAEYGILFELIAKIQRSTTMQLQLIVSGTHLSPEFGATWRQIEHDGFPIDANVEMQVASDTSVGVTKSMGLGLIGFADVLDRLKPDILVVLGDRYEALAITQSAMIARIPIAHIHGGESTQGLVDEAIRHSITKMAHLHFVAAENYRRRVLQLGEDPQRVWVVGASGLDNIAKLKPLSKTALEKGLKIKLITPTFLVTYHPVTLSHEDSALAMRTLLEVLDETGGTIIITGANSDTGGAILRSEATRFAADRAGRVVYVESLGSMRYLSLMHHADIVIGNSSSGLIEAPAVGISTVDIGERQSGRLLAPSVIHCSEDANEIRSAVKQALTVQHRKISARCQTPYGTPGSAERIARVLETYPLDGILKKRFIDFPSD
jgi:UDP-N-acetylglucosamine 2-epimerase (non-hydrolysing)